MVPESDIQSKIPVWELKMLPSAGWIVLTEHMAQLETFELIGSDRIILIARINSKKYVCERLLNPSSQDDLRAAAWRPVSEGSSDTIAPSDQPFLVEAVIAFNVHRGLGMPSNMLVRKGNRTIAVPYTTVGYCPKHDRAYYWDDSCPRCSDSSVTEIKEAA